MEALSASSPVWDEISMIVPVSSLILSTAFDPSMASCAFILTLLYIVIVLVLASTVLVRRSFARIMIASEVRAPSVAILLISSAPFLITSIFSLIVTVVAAVSSMPAASCWLVAELSEHM